MAVKISNSLGTFLEQSMILERNGLEIIEKINDAMKSDKDNITLTLTDPANPDKTTTYLIPSFGYLSKSIDRIDRTLESLMNISGNTNSTVNLSDGTYRKLITSSIPGEAPTINDVSNITNFNFKSNWFFEDMLNPCLYVSLNLGEQIDAETERIIIRRYILNCDTDVKKNIFDEQLKNKQLSFKDFVKILIDNHIRYTLDEDIRDLPPHYKKCTGTFTILNTSLPSTDYNGKITKEFKLNKLTYRNVDNHNDNILKVGDYLEVNTVPSNVRYKVLKVNEEKQSVLLEIVQGIDSLLRGKELKISKPKEITDVNVEIPVGFDEREVIFVKPIDTYSNVAAIDWSPSIAFFTNELNYIDRNNNVISLGEFYRKYVVDFGQVILSYAKDYFPSVREAVTPNKPELNKTNFRIVDINKHLYTLDYDEIKQLDSNKLTLKNELENLSNQISEKKSLIDNDTFESDEDKQNMIDELNSLINQHKSKSSEYETCINQINDKSSNFISPKYRVRGFWNMPKPQNSPQTGEQEVIKFRIRYKYLSNTGEESVKTIIPITENGTTTNAVFSNWNEMMTKTRERILSSTNEYVWKDIDLTTDDVKINQCELPIKKGEQIEIQVKSISEAGWPSNPIESDWSNSLVISFDEDLNMDEKSIELKEIIERNKIDLTVTNYLKNIKYFNI